MRCMLSQMNSVHSRHFIVLVSDNDVLMKDDSVDIRDSFKPSFRKCVHLLSNHRTRGFSGTGRLVSSYDCVSLTFFKLIIVANSIAILIPSVGM